MLCCLTAVLFLFFKQVDVWMVMVLGGAKCVLPCDGGTSTVRMDGQVGVLVMMGREGL